MQIKCTPTVYLSVLLLFAAALVWASTGEVSGTIDKHYTTASHWAKKLKTAVVAEPTASVVSERKAVGSNFTFSSSRVQPPDCDNPDNLCMDGFPDNLTVCVQFCNLPDAVVTDWHTVYNCSIDDLGGNCVKYTPLPGFFGNEELKLIGCNAAGQCDTVVVHIAVGVPCAEETAPVANNDNANTTENIPLTINVTNNDVATDGDAFTIESFTQPTNGTVTQVGDNLVYSPTNGFTGTDGFTYTICDNDGCDEAHGDGNGNRRRTNTAQRQQRQRHHAQ